MSTLDLPGMNFSDALVAWISMQTQWQPEDIVDATIVHEDYYSNGDTDWPETNYVSYRIIGSEGFRRIDIADPNGAFLYDLLRVGLMTTLVPAPAEEA